jgi:hypothetical protein
MFSIIKETCKNTKGCKCCYALPFNLYKNIDPKIPKVSKLSSTHNVSAQVQPSNNNSDKYIKKIKPFYMVD